MMDLRIDILYRNIALRYRSFSLYFRLSSYVIQNAWGTEMYRQQANFQLFVQYSVDSFTIFPLNYDFLSVMRGRQTLTQTNRQTESKYSTDEYFLSNSVWLPPPPPPPPSPPLPPTVASVISVLSLICSMLWLYYAYCMHWASVFYDPTCSGIYPPHYRPLVTRAKKMASARWLTIAWPLTSPAIFQCQTCD